MRSRSMMRRGFHILATGAALSFCGCATFVHNLSQSDDFLDFAMALRGHEHIEAFPLQLKSRGSGLIATGHAHKDAKGILISGAVEKRGPGWISAAWSHVDVVVIDQHGRVTNALSTKFSPSWVLSTPRGVVGRSRYSVRLSPVPPSGSLIQVAFHEETIARCPYKHST